MNINSLKLSFFTCSSVIKMVGRHSVMFGSSNCSMKYFLVVVVFVELEMESVSLYSLMMPWKYDTVLKHSMLVGYTKPFLRIWKAGYYCSLVTQKICSTNLNNLNYPFIIQSDLMLHDFNSNEFSVKIVLKVLEVSITS